MTSSPLFTLLLCGLAIGSNADTSPSVTSCTSCPLGWTSFNDRCYKFLDIANQWADAEKNCNFYNGNLASLRTMDEYNFVRDLIYKTVGSYKKAWVGGSDAVQNGDWFWSDGSNFNFNHWGPGEPNNLGGNEKCMDINLSGRDYVNDEVCSQLNSFVCARDP